MKRSYASAAEERGHDGTLIRAFKIPESLKPVNADGSYNFDGDGATGRRTNRGFESLAISPNGAFVYAMLQSVMIARAVAMGSVTASSSSTPGRATRSPSLPTGWTWPVRAAAYSPETAARGMRGHGRRP